LRLLAFQAGWFACVLGAARGMPVLGPVLVGAFVLLHLVANRRVWEREAALLAASALVGYAADSILVLAGVLRFPPQASLGGPSALWMVALWVNLALTLNGPLGWLKGRHALAALLGAAGGPLAYEAGARLGAASLGDPYWASLAAVAVEWSLAMPLLAALANAAADRPAGGRG
jgi:hypothetical protein